MTDGHPAGITDRITITVEDGSSVVAVVHRAKTDRWVVCSHGLVSDKSGSYEARCDRLVEAGWSAVRFDHRGCGESDGGFEQSTLTARLADLAAVVDHLELERYAVFGSSFGGTVALLTAARDERVAAVATRAPVTDLSRLAALEPPAGEAVDLGDGYSLDSTFFEDLHEHDVTGALERIDVPVGIVHGDEDASVPADDSVAALRYLSGDVWFERIAGEGHRFSREAETYLQARLVGWLEAAASRNGEILPD